MELFFCDNLKVDTTLVSNTFIDSHMAGANGEYVKVYLFLLRHQKDTITIPMIADALNHTEADVRRALAYWEKAGVLGDTEKPQSERSPAGKTDTAPKAQTSQKQPADENKVRSLRPEAPVPTDHKIGCSADQMSRLSQDEDFTQLLYIAQKYLNKVFTPRDCEIFGYLYGSLHLSYELLEYLVEYCAQSGHTSIRYIETVALSWYEKKLLTVEEAKAYAGSFTKDIFAVMKAFGLSDRKPGQSELSYITRWLKEYGFTRELVAEACNRTLAATHNPSFPYADKILSDWKQSGVRHLEDLAAIDQKYQAQKQDKQRPVSGSKTTRGGNRFHNFEQSSYDYDEMVWSMLKEQ